MTWEAIVGHDRQRELLGRAARRGRIAHAYLFVGPQGIGKRAFAREFAKALLCEGSPPFGAGAAPRSQAAERERGSPPYEEGARECSEADREASADTLEACGRCTSCRLMDAGTHPDFHVVAKEPDKTGLSIAQLAGPEERRGQEGLRHDLSLSPQRGRRRVAIIDDADDLSLEAANCLLKTLEEPPPRSLLILLGTSAERQLPTIRSRCQVLRFAPLAPSQVRDILLETGAVTDRGRAEALAGMSEGSVTRALELAEPELWDFRGKLTAALAEPDFDSVALAGRVVEFVESAGKEASARRERAKVVIGFCAAHYREMMRSLCGESPESRDDGRESLIEQTGDAIERCLEADEHVDRMVHVTLALEALVLDLGRAPARVS